MTNDDWRPMRGASRESLADARLQLHHAAQVVASTGFTYGLAKKDDSHTNLGWEDGALASRPFGPGDTLTARLVLGERALELRAEQTEAARFDLGARTLDEAFSWLAQAIANATNGALDRPLFRPDYDLPGHPFAEGAPFSADSNAAAELARWYHEADAALRETALGVRPGESVSAVRTWPHHFDIATLVSLDPDTDPESARSIGVGLSPGDDSCDEPYFYTRAYPFDGAEDLPELTPPGIWHTDGWYGMILRASDLAERAEAPRVIRAHLEETVGVAHSLLEDSA